MEILEEAKKVIEIEVNGIKNVIDFLDESFIDLINELNNCKGRIVITGMGKSGLIYKKVAATMASLGLKAYFMHPAEALHGDLGLVTKDDVVLAVSRSGESDEIIKLIPSIKKIGAKLLSITERSNCTLSKFSDITLLLPKTNEAYLDDLVPTTSTTVSLVVGDAIAIVLAKINGFETQDFAVFHPNGLLGKRLTLKVKDLMKIGESNATVERDCNVRQAVLEMCKRPTGCVSVIDKNNKFLGIFTDGDLRRLISKYGDDSLNKNITDVMNRDAITINEDALVIEALETMKVIENKFLSVLPVLKNGKLVGAICLSDISSVGLV